MTDLDASSPKNSGNDDDPTWGRDQYDDNAYDDLNVDNLDIGEDDDFMMRMRISAATTHGKIGATTPSVRGTYVSSASNSSILKPRVYNTTGPQPNITCVSFAETTWTT